MELRDGDRLIVPPSRQYVTVIGEAQNPTSHIWRRDLSRENYLSLSGGTTEMARNVIAERVLGMPREVSLDRDVPFRDVPRGSRR